MVFGFIPECGSLFLPLHSSNIWYTFDGCPCNITVYYATITYAYFKMWHCVLKPGVFISTVTLSNQSHQNLSSEKCSGVRDLCFKATCNDQYVWPAMKISIHYWMTILTYSWCRILVICHAYWTFGLAESSRCPFCDPLNPNGQAFLWLMITSGTIHCLVLIYWPLTTEGSADGFLCHSTTGESPCLSTILTHL